MMKLRRVLSVQGGSPKSRTRSVRALRVAVGAAAALATCRSGVAQTWTHLVRNPPSAVNLLLLLSDGTVLASNQNGSTIGRAWYKLTPDATGSYINGTWTTVASMIDTRLYYSSQVLRDGRVFVAGGEYGTGGAKAEVYDPILNTWTAAPVPTTLLNPGATSPVTGLSQQFYDSNSEILPDGRVIITPVCPKTAGQTLIWDPTQPAATAWTQGANLFRGSYQDEATWVKLPDNTFLTIDPFGTFSERYNPASGTWINDGIVPVALYDGIVFEMGGGLLLPNGKAFFLGSTGNTALYTPSGTTAPGTWAAGPVIPSGRGTPDAPCAMLINGKVLCAVSAIPSSASHFPSPTFFYEYDYVSNSFALVSAPAGSSDPIPTYQAIMLNLPSGQIMYSHMGLDVYVYTPSGSALAAGKPTIQTVTQNPDGSFHLTGTLLNGISEGASYGDDAQMNSNYPIVRINHSNGNKYFARSYNWSSTGVMTGATVTSTEYKLPTGLPAGSYSISVIANGIPSDPSAAPAITFDPANGSGCEGGSATMSVSASGTGPLTYQWRRGTTNLVDGGAISGATTSTLSINPTTLGHTGPDYNCIVSNSFGSATSANASLTITSCGCYANCDLSTTAPTLNANDFQCFLNSFAAGNSYANCDGSTADPVLNANDFQCFLNAFAAGCT